MQNYEENITGDQMKARCMLTDHVRLTLQLFKPEYEQQQKKWPEYEQQEHKVLTNVGRFFEIATNIRRLSTWVYTPLTGKGKNMKEPRAHGTVGGLRSKEPHEVRNQQQEPTVFGLWTSDPGLLSRQLRFFAFSMW